MNAEENLYKKPSLKTSCGDFKEGFLHTLSNLSKET